MKHPSDAMLAILKIQNTDELNSINESELSLILRECERLTLIIEQLKNRARKLLKDGSTINGWRVETRDKRVINDHQKCFKKIANVFGSEIAISSSKVNLTAAAKLVEQLRAITPEKATTLINSELTGLFDICSTDYLLKVRKYTAGKWCVR
jgi:hypothetical protein